VRQTDPTRHRSPEKKTVKRIAARASLGLLGILAFALVGLGATAQARWDRTFDVPVPVVHASSDADVVARGRYLVFGPAHCSYCHTPQGDWARLDAGEEIPLVGGYAFELPIGTFRSPNLTPDPETGIGRYTDGQLARMLRHGVRPDGRATLPVMEFQDMSDEDVVAVISYLRSRPAVRNEVPAHELNLLGKAVMAMLIGPTAPNGTPPATSPPAGPTVERGAYLANSVANCAGCHSPRSMTDGSYTGPRFSGGVMDVDGDPTHFFSVPNLTPDPETGHIVGWSADQFVARFRAGKLIEGSHMPWNAFQRMSNDDLRAIHAYLMSLDPVRHDTGPTLQKKK
jgi:mono/diheme cytochrome c family protein